MVPSNPPGLTPVQRVIYETDLLGLTLRDSSRIATQRAGFFIGQARYLEERKGIAEHVARYGPPILTERRADADSRGAAHQVGSP